MRGQELLDQPGVRVDPPPSGGEDAKRVNLRRTLSDIEHLYKEIQGVVDHSPIPETDAYWLWRKVADRLDKFFGRERR